MNDSSDDDQTLDAIADVLGTTRQPTPSAPVPVPELGHLPRPPGDLAADTDGAQGDDTPSSIVPATMFLRTPPRPTAASAPVTQRQFYAGLAGVLVVAALLAIVVGTVIR